MNMKLSICWKFDKEATQRDLHDHQKSKEDNMEENTNMTNGKLPSIMKQVNISTDAVMDLLDDCNEMVSNIQIANDLREINRRKNESLALSSRSLYLEKECEEAMVKLEDINSKWETILKLNDTLIINEACENQRRLCNALIDSKERIVNKLKNDLKNVDCRFDNDLKLHRDDVNLLSHRIDNQMNIMQNAYRQHLELIEKTIEHGRRITLDKKHNEWENLNSECDRNELEQMDERFKATEEHENELKKIVSDHNESYRHVKNDLELELQALRLLLEKTKAECLIMEQKMEYNYIVLTKRREELGRIKSQIKLKVNRLRSDYIDISRKKTASKLRHEQNCDKKEQETKKLQETVKEFKEKADRLNETSDDTYKEIWKLNEKRAIGLVNKILKVNRNIHETCLNVNWEVPKCPDLQISDLPSANFALKYLPNFQIKKSASDGCFTLDEETKSIVPDEMIHSRPVIFVLQNIAKYGDLILGKDSASLKAIVSDKNQTFVSTANILQALKISNISDLELLKEAFLPYIKCVSCDGTEDNWNRSNYQKSLVANQRTGSGNTLILKTRNADNRPGSARFKNKNRNSVPDIKTSACSNLEHTLTMNENLVPKIIADYMKSKAKQNSRALNQTSIKIGLSSVLSQTDVEMYWNKFRFVITDEQKQFWEATYTCLQKHLTLLQEKQEIKAEVNYLQRQNSELKHMLSLFINKIKSDSKGVL